MDAHVTDPALAGLKTSLEEKNVKFMLASYVDMHGVSKGKVVPVSHFSRMMSGSELCTGAALEGVPQDVSDEEVAAHPDPASCTVLPWKPDVACSRATCGAKENPSKPAAATSSHA